MSFLSVTSVLVLNPAWGVLPIFSALIDCPIRSSSSSLTRCSHSVLFAGASALPSSLSRSATISPTFCIVGRLSTSTSRGVNGVGVAVAWVNSGPAAASRAAIISSTVCSSRLPGTSPLSAAPSMRAHWLDCRSSSTRLTPWRASFGMFVAARSSPCVFSPPTSASRTDRLPSDMLCKRASARPTISAAVGVVPGRARSRASASPTFSAATASGFKAARIGAPAPRATALTPSATMGAALAPSKAAPMRAHGSICVPLVICPAVSEAMPGPTAPAITFCEALPGRPAAPPANDAMVSAYWPGMVLAS